MTSSDGFCSILTFSEAELGTQYVAEGSAATPHRPAFLSLSSQNTPVPTPTTGFAPPSPFHLTHQRSSSQQSNPGLPTGITAPSPPASNVGSASGATGNGGNASSHSSFFAARPTSPTRSNSTSSIATQASIAHHAQPSTIISNPPLVSGSVPGVTASASGSSFSAAAGVLAGKAGVATPPQTPRSTASSVSGLKRDASESEKEDVASGQSQPKKRRIAPTPVEGPR